MVQIQRKSLFWRTKSKSKTEWGLGTSHSEIGMKLRSMCCSSQHEQTQTNQLWGTAGKGTENKMELDGFEHIWNHCVPSSGVLWVDLGSASQEGVVGWPQTEAKLPPRHSLNPYPQHNAGRKWGWGGRSLWVEITYQVLLQAKKDSTWGKLTWFTVDEY